MNYSHKPWILGINASHHNGSACLLRGDEIVVAIQEERLTRKKRDSLRMPRPLSIDYCLNYAGINQRELDLVVVCGLISQALLVSQFEKIFPETTILSLSHHLSHAIGAFATSGFNEAAVLIVDGCGSEVEDLQKEELYSVKQTFYSSPSRYKEIISLYQASGIELKCIEKHLGSDSRELPFASLGNLYETVANVIFGYDAAGKVMGLAPYGKVQIPKNDFFKIIDGKFIFQNLRLKAIEKWPAHQSLHKNLAASVQAAIEEALLYLIKHLKQLCPSRNLVFSGGVALNSVANEKIIQEKCFVYVYFMPAAEDSGNAIGAAYYGLWQLTKRNTQRFLLKDSLGKKYNKKEIDDAILKTPAIKIHQSSDNDKTIISNVVEMLIEGKIVAWFQGGSELGPRSLGQRSIICDPRLPNAKDYLNTKVKHREAFRPFAPAILEEEAKNWFELEHLDRNCHFMMRVCKFREEKKGLVPSVVHIDGTGRIQTLSNNIHGKFYELVRAFYKETGIPLILNTSFNVMNEPIIETPEDALWALIYTGIDYCVIENNIITKVESFQSILDLYPYIAALTDLDKLEKQVIKSEELYNFSYAKSFSLRVKNRWGEFISICETKCISILNLIDGNSTGWSIMKKYNQQYKNLDENSFINLLGLLRRKSILNFHSEPSNGKNKLNL